MKSSLWIVCCGCMLLAAAAPGWAQMEEHVPVPKSSPRFLQQYDEAVKLLQKKGFDEMLESPSLGASSTQKFDAMKKAILGAADNLADVDRADRDTIYDVILQPGHYMRKKGAVGTSGTHVSEKALVAYISNEIAKALRAQSLHVLVVSADEYLRDDQGKPGWQGLRAKQFLAIHADGSTVPCKTGPSLAYQSSNSTMAMHAIGWALGQALGYTYSEFMKDGFTANEANYYMFKQVDASTMKGLLEVGELTCLDKETRLISSADLVGANVAAALVFIHKTGAP
ncbi:N-acetylmuramoyl-L-alanine amidase [Massilia sp. BJB1822]|uniref:N-acetylmuramoyl-L-alanine amidase n=1 Tax=Massilia sp. BJB1822 TaxID=2744470 RepID=UPI00159396D2|nr:N-acetylmuramoyl-L-alanine amidase [Massilia sp. BJB1822]NVD97908.1 N-acetylmuramoyl-L-alanine amidase [Massilia sp. BJB1822]